GFIVTRNLIFFFVFFFSSRRRHTRSKRDWSSDVCSSDLGDVVKVKTRDASLKMARETLAKGAVRIPDFLELTNNQDAPEGRMTRSEERRVGKECRSRWWQEQ